MFSSDRSPWSLPPLCCSILLSLYRAHYAGICPSSWVFFARNTRHETGLEWRQTSKCSVLTAILNLPSTGATVRLLQYERSPPMPAAAQAAITLPRTVATPPRLGYGSTCFRADLQVFSSGILNMPSLRPAVPSPLLPGTPVMQALRL